MHNYVIVNATALANSGALTILEQFYEAIPNDKYKYLVFVNSGVNLTNTQPNIIVVPQNVKSFIKRFYWDVFGVKVWLKKNKINPIATISLQNTNFRTNKSNPNFIYYHQPIPLFNARWNPLKKGERRLWFYKKIYPLFVNLFINNNTEVFVQLKFIKDGFAKYFDFPNDKIHVITPTIELPSLQEADQSTLDKSQLNLFYPATPFIYKNHSIILEALSKLDSELQKKITIHVTCEKAELKHLYIDSEILYNINFMGKISFNKVLGMYNNADALLFPSFIETFGLPLIEAASFGLPIIAADLPYSREVLKDYEGVNFVPYNNAFEWGNEISKLNATKGRRYEPIKIEESNSWQELFRIVKNKIQNHV